MKVQVKIFPAAGLCDQKQEFEIVLNKGNFAELETRLEERFGINPLPIESLIFLHNGRGLDGRRENVTFQDGDLLWLLPQISGG